MIWREVDAYCDSHQRQHYESLLHKMDINIAVCI